MVVPGGGAARFQHVNARPQEGHSEELRLSGGATECGNFRDKLWRVTSCDGFDATVGNCAVAQGHTIFAERNPRPRDYGPTERGRARKCQGRLNQTYCQPPEMVLNFDPMLPVTPEL
jgi:hypothetical protein